MTVLELQEKTEWSCLSDHGNHHTVESVFSGDLLSYVMGHALSDQAWVTMQTHQNVIAIAALKDLACVILIDDNQPDEDALMSAKEHEIPILISPLSAFETIKVLVNLGL